MRVGLQPADLACLLDLAEHIHSSGVERGNRVGLTAIDPGG